jgi:protein-tyrosine phosphatase
MLDFHSHILPGIDDGSKSIGMSLKMLQISRNQGVDGIVLTPHFYADQDTPDRFLRRRAKSADLLRQELGRLQRCPALLLGAEVHYFHGMGRSTDLEKFCIGSSNLILVEMPFQPWSSRMLQDVEEIHDRLGLQVIIAHIDRYLSVESAEGVEALRDAGVIIQANADFFLQRSRRRKAIKMLERQEIQLLGSDCHNLTSRAPNLDQAVKFIQKKLGDSGLDSVDALGKTLFRSAGAEV